MKKILITSYDQVRNPYYAGGGARAVHGLAQALGKWYEVNVLTAPFRQSHAGINEIENVDYQVVGPRMPQPQLAQLAYLVWLVGTIRNYRADLVIESLAPPFTGTLLPWFSDKPVLGVVHLLSGRSMAEKYHNRFFLNLETLLLSKYKNIVALTSTSRQQIARLAPQAKITVIGNGVTIPKQLANRPRKNWLYLGRIDEKQKGMGLLIKAYEQTVGQVDWDLNIAGSGTAEEIARLQRLIKVSGYSNRIHYLGRVEGGVKEKLLSEAGALVLPSRYETQPVSLLEAFAYGCPVLYTKIPDLAWIPREIAWRAGRTERELAEAMRRVYKATGERAARARLARQYVERYRWDKIAELYHPLIEGLT